MDAPLLAFDTSAAHCAAVVVREGRVVQQALEPMARGQAEALMPLLERLLQAERLAWRDLGAIGVGIGPGNFTGIRISVSAARGLALGLGVPAIGLSTFELMLDGAGLPSASDLVSVAAPRDRAYVQRFAHGRPVDGPELIDLGTPTEFTLPPETRVVGYEAQAIARATGATGDEAEIDDLPARLAAVLTRKAAEGAPAKRPAPLYVRPADAAPSRDAPPEILA